VFIDAGEQVGVTDVTVGVTGGGVPPLLIPPPQPATPVRIPATSNRFANHHPKITDLERLTVLPIELPLKKGLAVTILLLRQVSCDSR
jgi:hypothetical protein